MKESELIDKLVDEIEKIKDEISFIKKELKKLKEDVSIIDVSVIELKKRFEKHYHITHRCDTDYPTVSD